MEKHQQFSSSPSFLLIGRDMPETCRKQILIKHLDPSKIVVIFPQTEFRVEKVIKKTRDKLYLKYKGSGNSFNSFIDRKGIAM